MARILSFEEREWGGTTTYYVTMSEYSLFEQGCTTDQVSVSMGRYYTLRSSLGIISSEERKRGGTPYQVTVCILSLGILNFEERKRGGTTY